MAPPLVLWVLLAARATALSCVCTPSECEEVLEWECPGGGVVWDACGCCRVCARVEDEPCGGPDGFHGSCAPGLHCVLDPSQLLPQRAQRGEARGTCKRVPGILVGALNEDGGQMGPCPLGTTQDSVFGCDIVGRVCRCSSLPACTGGSEARGGRKRRESGVGGETGRRRKRDSSEGEEEGENKSPFTFSTLEECEMNLAEVLRQEEVPPSSVRGFVSLSGGRNCTVSGCDSTDNLLGGLSPEGDRCPEGSARVEGSSVGAGGGGSGPCVCLPSLCPTAYLPFSCPFGARVLRRASRIPGDCCDQYECASPPPDFRELVAEAAKEDEAVTSTSASLGGSRESKVGEREPAQKKTLCPKGSESSKMVIGCDIVGRVCRCTRLPACSSGGTRSRKRRKKGSGRGGGGGMGREDVDNDVTRNPFTFTTLDECKDRLADLLSKEEEEEEEADGDEEVETSDSRGE